MIFTQLRYIHDYENSFTRFDKIIMIEPSYKIKIFHLVYFRFCIFTHSWIACRKKALKVIYFQNDMISKFNFSSFGVRPLYTFQLRQDLIFWSYVKNLATTESVYFVYEFLEIVEFSYVLIIPLHLFRRRSGRSMLNVWGLHLYIRLGSLLLDEKNLQSIMMSQGFMERCHYFILVKPVQTCCAIWAICFLIRKRTQIYVGWWRV